MTHLLEKDTPFVFDEECMKAFEFLKERLVSAPILVAPDWSLPFELMCDASDQAVGAVLGQRSEKHFHPIYYARKTLKDAQEIYTTTEKVLLAVVFAFDKFRSYLVLSKTTVFTEHLAWRFLFAKKDAKPCLIRWILLLSEFDIEIKDKRGAENVAADHLSRLEDPERSEIREEEIGDRFPHEMIDFVEAEKQGMPWFTDLANFLAHGVVIEGMTSQQKKKFFRDAGKFLIILMHERWIGATRPSILGTPPPYSTVNPVSYSNNGANSSPKSSSNQNHLWYVDSGGSRHMTGHRSILNDFIPNNGGYVSFGNNAKGWIVGSGYVSRGNLKFKDVSLVENLKFNLLSVSQLADKNFNSFFTKDSCKILSPEINSKIKVLIDQHTLLTARRRGNVYVVDMTTDSQTSSPTCLIAKASSSETTLWHRRLSHLNHQTLHKLSTLSLVRGLPSKEFHFEGQCESCLKGKQHKTSYNSIEESKTTNCLNLLHMDLFGPVKVASLARKRYCLVVVDDYSRFCWTFFLFSKDETSDKIIALVTHLERQFSLPVKIIRSDNGTEFKNQVLDKFCISKGILRQYSAPRTPAQNGVVERKNRTLIEAARTMLADSGLPLSFWAEAVNIACYVLNRVHIVKRHNKTAYEVLYNIKPLISFFKVFGCPCFILNTKDFLSKFAAKVDSGYFVGYSQTSKAYRAFNLRTKIIEESIDVKFNELASTSSFPSAPDDLFDLESFSFIPSIPSSSPSTESCQTSEDLSSIEEDSVSKFLTSFPSHQINSQEANSQNQDDIPSTPLSPVLDNASIDVPDHILNSLSPIENSSSSYAASSNNCLDIIPFNKNHPLEQILGDLSKGVQTRSQISNFCLHAAFLSQIEPSKYQKALKDNNWIEAMQDELLQFKRQNVWTLCPLPDGKYPIGTRWVFRNKTDDRGIIIKTKARLVVQGYCQEEGIDYDETFAPVERLEAIRFFLAFAISHNIKVYQMDIKSAFLYGTIKEEVYVCQPPGFDDVHHPDWVYKLDKALYGLKQAPRAWYDTLSQFLLSNIFSRGTIDKTLFIKRVDKELLLVQIYVDDIIFGSTKQSMCEQFSKLMSSKFEMSALSELKTFLGLQVKQTPHGTFIHQSKYVKDLLNKFDMNDCKIISTPMATSPGICPDDNGEPIDQTLYRCMIGSLMYLTASRPDIMYATCVCARYQSAPKQSHLSFVKRILRYLKGTPVLGIWYPANKICKLVGFTDSDYAGCSLTRKSTSGGCQFFAGCLVSWQSKKQTSVSNSTAEAEYITAAHCTAQIFWLQYQLLDFGITELKTPLLIDSEAAKNIIKNPVYHSKTKHIEIRHHFIRDCFEKGLIVPEHTTASEDKSSEEPSEDTNKRQLLPKTNKRKMLPKTILQKLLWKTLSEDKPQKTLSEENFCFRKIKVIYFGRLPKTSASEEKQYFRRHMFLLMKE
ncbi:hypothetical protein E3N88_18808 [Mikania micrantha]|uniref:Integrase catalytic domain-containing protein n=1 Tax=Mikania micrantha TaxID=192012 RepID=A0A5N6NLI9_9ASTR|nr:hypothetical protein E3N88_18808 [Mikania micrantha]